MAIINDGFSTTIEFSVVSSGVTVALLLKEKDVTPPGVDGGGENDTTTMRNTAFRTKQPKNLKTLTDASFTAAYDVAVYDEIMELINTNQLITITFPDSSTLAFWGWLNTFVPNTVEEGAQPTAECTLVPSNQNDAGAETAPVYSA